MTRLRLSLEIIQIPERVHCKSVFFSVIFVSRIIMISLQYSISLLLLKIFACMFCRNHIILLVFHLLSICILFFHIIFCNLSQCRKQNVCPVLNSIQYETVPLSLCLAQSCFTIYLCRQTLAISPKQTLLQTYSYFIQANKIFMPMDLSNKVRIQ